MKKSALALLAVAGIMASAGCPPKTISTAPDKVISKAGWALKIWVTAKGTRSEGRVSHLYYNGKEVCPEGDKVNISTPLGVMKYSDPPYLWGWHGWKPVDAKRFPAIGP